MMEKGTDTSKITLGGKLLIKSEIFFISNMGSLVTEKGLWEKKCFFEVGYFTVKFKFKEGSLNSVPW